MRLTQKQTQIVEHLKNGSKLQCTEGLNYKTWLVHPDGSIENIQRRSAEKICNLYEDKLVFGDWDGIYWRKRVK